MNPPVTGFSVDPSMETIRPSWTTTSRLQESGQSSGHTVVTVCSLLYVDTAFMTGVYRAAR
jgi:hypothetical protein